MNEERNKLADEILQFLGPHITPKYKLTIEEHFCPYGKDIGELQNVVAALKHEEVIESKIMQHGHEHYQLTVKGLGLTESRKSFQTYLKQKEENEKISAKRLDRDDELKDRQLEEIEFRLKTIEDMQERQKRFWGKQNISIILSLGALLTAIITLIAKLLLG